MVESHAPLDDENPQDLMLQAKNGDAQAFERLYTLYYTPVFRYLYLRVKEKRLSEDLTQTVFIKVYNALPRYKDQNAHPLAYFFTVARTTLIDHFRKEKKAPITSDEKVAKASETVLDPHNHAEEKETKELVSIALDELTDDQKEIIVLKFLEERSNKEIAEITGKKEEAIRQLQLRALRRLREYFNEENIL